MNTAPLNVRRTFSSRSHYRAASRNRRGAMLVIIAVMIIAYMFTVAFSVDVAYMHLVRSELRTATDAASRAASQALVKTNSRSAAIAAGKGNSPRKPGRRYRPGTSRF